MNTYIVKRSDDYLAHHGILGQKWGKRNGPPYPLGANDHSAAEKKAGYTKSISGSDKSESSKTKFQLTDKQKKAIKIGAAAVVAGLAAYGGYRLYKSGVIQNYVNRGKVFGSLDDNISRIPIDDIVIDDVQFGDAGAFDTSKVHEDIKELAERTGLKLKSTVTSFEDDVKMVNEKYRTDHEAYTNNCAPSSIALVLRRFGLDVQAKPSINKHPDGSPRGMSIEDIRKYFIGLAEDKLSIDHGLDTKGVRNAITQQIIEKSGGDKIGSAGLLGLKNAGKGENHFIMWSNENGKIVFGDGQLVQELDLLPEKWKNAINDDPTDVLFDQISKGNFLNDMVSISLDPDYVTPTSRILEIVENRT